MGTEHERELARVLQSVTAKASGLGAERMSNGGVRRRRAAEPSTRTGLARIERPPSLTERVLAQLRNAILNRELGPGQAIVIEQLADHLGVSRTPIREALPALQQLGLIEDAGNGSFRVAPLDVTYVWQVYAVRSALESLLVEVVTPLLTEDDLRTLREVSFPATPRPEGDYYEMFGPDLALHDFLRDKCPLGFLNAMIDAVQVHRGRLLDLEHSASPDHRKASYQEHQAIVTALEQRDGATARKLMQEHLDRIGAEVAKVAEDAERRSPPARP